MLATLAIAILAQAQPLLHQPDTAPLNDPSRPVTQITPNSFTLHYYTSTPEETRVQFRQDEIPMTAFGRTAPVIWKTASAREGKVTMHTLTVSGLQPGKRYYYRIFDPGITPTGQEKNWGAGDGYRREYAVSTQAPKGQKTIIHLPVKVLLMPNVVNVVSAYGDRSDPAPAPKALTPEEIEKIKREYGIASRFFWVNSGMRLWVDYQIFVDDRWQRWGPEPSTAAGFYKDLPVSRSYPGRDYADPGGGDFTIVDTKDVQKVSKDPIVEARPYSGQVEQAFVRRWNAATKKWEFYNSGGGTFGVDQWPQGFPGRSQFLGGGDTAWLATHEFHHDMESHGEFSLSNREDDRIVFNHYAPRKRVVNGSNVDENVWTTNGPHGEHWDGMAYWDRTLTDCQWLRMYFGYTETVKDADGDGVPDDDPRLPLDEKRFGSDARKAMTDGAMNDLDKVMLATWAPEPLQPTWIKVDQFPAAIPKPRTKDSDGDGLDDGADRYPLYPYEPVIVPMHAAIDGKDDEWKNVPLGGKINSPTGVEMTFKQSHDEAGYYGCFTVKGPWKRIDAIFDGEGYGVYSGNGVQSFQVLNLASRGAAGPEVGDVDVRISPFKAPGLKWKSSRQGDTTIFEFSLPNRGEGIWYWHRGGREIGSEINVWDSQDHGFAMAGPYQIFYAKMLEPYGQPPLPSDAPSELQTEGDTTVLLPGDPKLKSSGDWSREGDALVYKGGDPEGSLFVEVPKTGDFDLLAIIEASSDGIVGAFAQGQKIGAGVGYVGFVGGYGNLSTRMRLAGQEFGDEPVAMTPGKHRVQLSRRDGEVWMLVDGKPLLWAPDPTPQLEVNRLAVIGGYNGNQKVYELRYRRG